MIAKWASVLLVALALSTAVAAACGDRPGTPDNVRAEATSASSITFRFRNTTRWVNRMCFDIEVRDGRGNPVGRDITGGDCAGAGYHQPRYHVFTGLRADTEFCFRIRARTEPGTQGCVSAIWSARVCARTRPLPVPGGGASVVRACQDCRNNCAKRRGLCLNLGSPGCEERFRSCSRVCLFRYCLRS
jgi:hypothetical protein